MNVRDRVKELRRVRAGDLLPNPKNWRTHPAAQADALRGVLAEIGYADALLARETDGGLMLVDGHLRAETTPDVEVPVLVLDLDEAEADKLLLTLDPLASMAGANVERLGALAGVVETNSEAVQAMIDRTRGLTNDPLAEWQGMPEFHQDDQTSAFQVVVHFATREDLAAFAALVKQTLTENTRAIWYPKAEVDHFVGRRVYATNGS